MTDASPAGPKPFATRTPSAPGRPYPPAAVASVRDLIAAAGLSHREAARRAGLPVDTVGRWARRFGWRRAAAEDPSGRGDGPRSATPANPPRPHAEELVIGGAEALASGSTARAAPPQGDAGRGVRRPWRYDPALVAAARARVEGSREPMERIGLALGVARATLYGWARRGGWLRPAPPEALPRRPLHYRSRRLGRPYGGDAVGIARDLVQGSRLPARRIAAQAGVSRGTVHH